MNELCASKVSPKSSSQPPLCSYVREQQKHDHDHHDHHNGNPHCSKAVCALRSSPNKRWPSFMTELGTQAARQVDAEGSLAGVGWKPPGSFMDACYHD